MKFVKTQTEYSYAAEIKATLAERTKNRICDDNNIYLYIFVGVDFICAVALKAIFNHAVVNRGYSLYFVKDSLSIPHEQLKEFMPQNNMK